MSRSGSPPRPGRVRRPGRGGGAHLRPPAARRAGRPRPAARRARAGHRPVPRPPGAADTGEVIKALETAVLKTVAAFANSRHGGTLLIGVADDGDVHGLASDYASLRKPDKDDRDRFLLHLNQLLVDAVGEAAASTVSSQLHTVDEQDLCRVHVPPSGFPVEATVKVDKGGQRVTKTAFYVRIGNGTREITDPAERQKYIASRWGPTASDAAEV